MKIAGKIVVNERKIYKIILKSEFRANLKEIEAFISVLEVLIIGLNK